MKEAYVSFETAKLLKEKGFDEAVNRFYELSTGEPSLVRTEYCRNRYTTSFAAPTHQMACAWLREEKNLWCEITWEGKNSWCSEIFDLIKEEYISKSIKHNVRTYEEAVEAALKYCLENLI